MKKPDGGYAFPQGLDHSRAFVGCEGMTLRDYFAAASLITIGVTMRAQNVMAAPNEIAKAAYAMADGLLAEPENAV